MKITFFKFRSLSPSRSGRLSLLSFLPLETTSCKTLLCVPRVRASGWRIAGDGETSSLSLFLLIFWLARRGRRRLWSTAKKENQIALTSPSPALLAHRAPLLSTRTTKVSDAFIGSFWGYAAARRRQWCLSPSQLFASAVDVLRNRRNVFSKCSNGLFSPSPFRSPVPSYPL